MFASPLFWQIRYLVSNATKKNLKSSIAELNQLIELYGEDARLFLLQCLVEETGFKEQKANTHNTNKDALKIQLLQHEIAQATEGSNFASAICRALEGSAGAGRDRTDQAHGRHAGRGSIQGQQGGPRLSEEFLAGFCRALKLTPPQQVAVGLGLSRSPNPAVSKEGVKFLVARVPGLVGGASGRLSLEALHSLLEVVNTSDEIAAQPRVAKSLLQQIQGAHQELLGVLEGDTGEHSSAGGARGEGRSSGGGSGAAGYKGSGGGEATSSSDASNGASISLAESDALALVPLFTSQPDQMNFLNKTSGAMSLATDVAGIANSIGQTGCLAGFLQDLGHTCCTSTTTLRQAIRESGVVVDERQVAQIITMLAQNYNNVKGPGDDGDLSSALTNSLFSSTGEGQVAAESNRDGGGHGGQGQWKLEVARQVLTEDYGLRLDWIKVARGFDHDRFSISDQNAFRVLLALYRGPAGRDLPPEALFRQWQNRRGHLSLLRAAINAPPQVYTFASSLSKQAPLEDVDASAATPNGAWLSLDLVASLLSLASDTELYAQVRDVFSIPAYQCPELLLLALAAVPSDAGGSLRVEMLSRLLPLYFRPNRNIHATALIRRLWQVNPRLVVQSGVKAFNVDSTLPSVVYVLRIMRMVPECASELLGSDDCQFAVAVASVAHGAEAAPPSNAATGVEQLPRPGLDLEKWCTERLARPDAESFASMVLAFVKANLANAKSRLQAQKPSEVPNEGALPTCAMSIEAAAIFLRSLGAVGLITNEAVALSKKAPSIQAAATQLAEAGKKMHSHLTQLLNPGGDIVDLANKYFERIYSSKLSIDEVMVMLQQFKSSSDSREQELFACMVHNLFDEYRFFHKYPEKELRITGILFGSLIQHQLVSSITLGIALRYVLEALRRPPSADPNGGMFRFGMYALEQFKSRLGEWPQYCSHIVQIGHLAANHPDLVREIEQSMQRQGATPTPAGQAPIGPQGASGQPGNNANRSTSDSAADGNAGSTNESSAVVQDHQGRENSDRSGLEAGLSPGSGLDFRAGSRQVSSAAPKLGVSAGPSQVSAQAADPSTGPAQASPSQQDGTDLGQLPQLGRSMYQVTQSSDSPLDGASGSGQAFGKEVDSGAFRGTGAAPGSQLGRESKEGVTDAFGAPTGRLGPELGLTAALGLGGGTAQSVGMGNIGGGLATGALGHETWGTTARQESVSNADLAGSFNGTGGQGEGEPLRPPSGALPPKQPEGLGTPNMDILMAKVEEPTAAVVNPPEAVMDRIHFVINNVTATNLASKVSEIKSHVQEHPEHHPWLANYLVVKRICTQPNFHDLYLELVNQLEAPTLMESILRSVFYNVSKLLKSQKIITSTSERSLLKNLGSWLGKITLGQEKPVLQRELDMKELLFQGYETGRLIAVTPFVAKILEGAPGKSRIFKPPNPWIMGLFSALHEMYELQDLKMNIKFEIEMLCQKFNVTLSEVPKYGRLRTRMSPNKAKNPDFNLSASRAAARADMVREREGSAASVGAGPEGGGSEAGTSGATNRDVGVEGRGNTDMSRSNDRSAGQKHDQQTVIPNLASYVTINPSLEAFSTQPQLKEVLKRVVPVAVDRAIREIIQPVVERSVTMACITTKELVMKDFAMEPDENKMRKAAHLMVSNLAGSLALVTCKEPLRVSIGTHMRSLLASGTSHTDQSTTETLVQLCSAENLELGCMLIEKAATEKAMRDIDEAVAPSLQARRKSRETTGQPFYDMSIFSTLRYPGALPDALRPKPGGLHPHHLLVYESFQRVPRQPSMTRSPAGPAGSAGPPGAPAASASAPPSPASPLLPRAGGGPPSQGLSPKGVELTLDQALSAWQGAIGRLDMAIGGLLAAQRRAGGPELNLHAVNRDADLSAALSEIVTVGKSVPLSTREEALTKFAHAVFNRLFDMARGKEDNPAGVPLLRVEVYAVVLELCLRTVKTSLASARKEDLLSQWYTSLPPQALAGAGSRKLHLGALKYLVKSNMVDLEKVDAFLVRNMAMPMQGPQDHQQQQEDWALYAMALIRQCVFEHPMAMEPEAKAFQVTTMKSFAKSLETLSQLSEKRPHLAQQFLQLASELRVTTHLDQGRKMGPGGVDNKSPAMHGTKGVMSPIPRAPGTPNMGANRSDPIGSREEVTQLLQYWIRLRNESPGGGDEKAAQAFLQLLNQRGVLKSEEATERFLRVGTELVVEACLKSGRSPVASPDEKSKSAKQLNYAVADALVKLLVVLVRNTKGGDASASMTGRLAMLNKQLSIIGRVLMQDFEAKKAAGLGQGSAFDQRPYYRLFLGMLQELNKQDRNLDTSSLQVLAAFASVFHALQPAACPGFAFAWLELISHRTFMPSLLLVKQNKGWALMHRLLVDLLIFLEPHLRRAQLFDAVRLLYKGMLRTLLVLLHDFPEFLCDYHLSFCDVIPPSCIQLRNLVLSSFPRSMRLPDPFTPNLKVDLLPEIALAPRILSNYVAALSHNGIRADLDKFLQTRHKPTEFLSELTSKLRHSPQEAAHTGMTYNVSCINALVVYVGSQAILQLNNKTLVNTHSAPMDVFHQLANKLDPEGRYFFLNAVANQLRYPNQHTHYFSCVLLYLFAEAQSEMVQEQITRILLERLIVHRPHPWGVLITFIELIKNPRYSFWSHSFTHCAPELERVFESVARSCMTPGSTGVGPGGDDDDAVNTPQ